MRNDDRYIKSPGTRYFPPAFEPEPYKLGKAVADDPNFYRALLQYILLVQARPTQLVHFRGAIIREVTRSIGEDRAALHKKLVHVPRGTWDDKTTEPKIVVTIPTVTWCALSLASDRYFQETAHEFGWTDAEMEPIRAQWYDMLAPAFIPTDNNRRLDISVIVQFGKDIHKLHRRDMGPFRACDLCASKCQYNYHVEQLTQDAKLRSDFQECVTSEDTHIEESVAWFCRLLSNRVLGKDNIDFAYCLAIHLLHALEKKVAGELPEDLPEQVHKSVRFFTTDADNVMALSTQSRIEDQILEVIVKQAMAGGDWQQMCAATMEKNNIGERQVETELLRRKQSVVDLLALDSHESAAVLSGRGMRSLAIEAVAQQASAGLEWQQLSSHIVRCFNITPAEIDAELRRQLR